MKVSLTSRERTGTGLTYLDLGEIYLNPGNTNIGDEGCKNILRSYTPKLEKVNLNTTILMNIGDSGLMHLSRASLGEFDNFGNLSEMRLLARPGDSRRVSLPNEKML